MHNCIANGVRTVAAAIDIDVLLVTAANNLQLQNGVAVHAQPSQAALRLGYVQQD